MKRVWTRMTRQALAAAVLLAGSSLALAQTQTIGGTGGGITSLGGGGGSLTTIGGTGGSGGMVRGGGSGQGFGGGGSQGGLGSFGSGQTTNFGNTGMLNTGLLGQTTGRSGAVAPSNLFGTTYGNPLAAGAVGASSTFGQPLYNVTTTTTTTTNLAGLGTLGGTRAATGGLRTTGGVGGVGGLAGVRTGNSLTGGPGNTGMAVPGRPAYVTGLVGVPPRLETAPRVQANLNQVLARTASLPARDNVRLSMDGDVVVMRGTIRAGSPDEADRQRKLIETVLRLQPGVRDVRNELEVEAELPPPRPAR
jgi:hypothetical protein